MNLSRPLTRTALVVTAVAGATLATAGAAHAANPQTTASQTVYTAACPDASQSLVLIGNQIEARTEANKAMGAQCTAGTVLNQAVYVINRAGTVLTSQGAADTVGDLGYTYDAVNRLAYSIPKGGRVELQSVTTTNGVNSAVHVLRVYWNGRTESLKV